MDSSSIADSTAPRAEPGVRFVEQLVGSPAFVAHPPGSIELGRIDAVDVAGAVFVAGVREPERAAASLVAVSAADIGRDVAFTRTLPAAGVLILGFVHTPSITQAPPVERAAPYSANVDGEEVQISAREQLTLRCGEASITLTADGQILLRGRFIDSHSTGTQRIKGAAVRIN